MAALGRPVSYDDRQITHRTIPMTNERSKALALAAAMLGVSRATLITRLIDSGLSVILSPPKELSPMAYSSVEHLAIQFRQEDVDNPECPRLLNGLHAEDTDPPHCQRCANLIRACMPRPYRVYDEYGFPIVSDCVVV